MPSSDLLLPEGSVLLHVGPYKTGSTTIQTRMARSREELAAYGVAYPPPPFAPDWSGYHRANRPGWALLRWAPAGFTVPPIEVWDEFASTVRDSPSPRVCVSTEDFGSTGDVAKARKIVADLGGDNVHVVAVCRAFHRLLPSHWQERVKSALDVRTYDEWLRAVLAPGSRDDDGEGFWKSHDLDRTASAWLAAVGPERFTLLATDDSDRGLLPRTFEEMLGLPSHFLDAEQNSNSSLSMNGTELIRKLNEAAHEGHWPAGTYTKLIRGGVLRGLSTSGGSEIDERIPALPEWAVDGVAAMSRQRLETIDRLGIHVVGDPSCLLLPDDVPTSSGSGAPPQLSMQAAVGAVAGTMRRTYHLEEDGWRRYEYAVEQRVRRARLGELLAELVKRPVRRLLGRSEPPMDWRADAQRSLLMVHERIGGPPPTADAVPVEELPPGD